MNFISPNRLGEGKNIFRGEFVPGMEIVAPVIVGNFLVVVKAVLGNILSRVIQKPARVKIRFGLKIGFSLAGLIRPLPFELGRDFVVINNFQGLGLRRAGCDQKAEYKNRLEQGFHNTS